MALLENTYSNIDEEENDEVRSKISRVGLEFFFDQLPCRFHTTSTKYKNIKLDHLILAECINKLYFKCETLEEDNYL